VVVSLSLVHKNDKFNMKDGVNQARKNAKRTGESVNLSKEHSAALDKFIHRAEKYFRVEIPVENSNNWAGKIVELLNSQGQSLNTPVFYKVIRDVDEALVDVVYVGVDKNSKPQKRTFINQNRSIFALAE